MERVNKRCGLSKYEARVRWSLPLSRLQYDGDPAMMAKFFDLGSSRVSGNQLMLVALRCLSQQ